MLGDLFLAGGFAEFHVTDGALKLSQALQAGRPFVTLVGKPHAGKIRIRYNMVSETLSHRWGTQAFGGSPAGRPFVILVAKPHARKKK